MLRTCIRSIARFRWHWESIPRRFHGKCGRFLMPSPAAESAHRSGMHKAITVQLLQLTPLNGFLGSHMLLSAASMDSLTQCPISSCRLNALAGGSVCNPRRKLSSLPRERLAQVRRFFAMTHLVHKCCAGISSFAGFEVFCTACVRAALPLPLRPTGLSCGGQFVVPKAFVGDSGDGGILAGSV